ncbi:MAG: hypothetical protein SOV22_06820 [Blautia obeum]|nr:hypothetical protein [Blautia obeum]
MSDIEYLSMKQIANQLNVSKQRVYRCIKSNCISEAHYEVVKGNTVLMYDNAAVERIKQLLGVTNDETVEVHREVHQEAGEAHHETVHDTVYEALLKQLEIKDQQIKELNERLAEAHKSLDQEQQLHLLSKQRIKELEEKPTEPESPDQEESAAEQTAAEQTAGEKKGFFRKILDVIQGRESY